MDTEGKSPGVWSNPPPMLCKEHAAYIIEMAIKRQQRERERDRKSVTFNPPICTI